MVDADILLGKVAVVQRCLLRIREMTKRDGSLEELLSQDVVTLNLQRAIQACIDLAAHIVKEERLGVPASHAEYFTILREGRLISNEVEQTMKRMTAFRNIAVHEYQELGGDILRDVAVNRLHDFEAFYGPLLKRYINTSVQP